MSLYRDNILDHAKYPRKYGTLSDPSAAAAQKNPSCGDDVSVEVVIEDGVITQLAWQGQGCVMSKAAMSAVAEAIEQTAAVEVLNWDLATIEELLDFDEPISPGRQKCALLGLQTLQGILKSNLS